MFVNIYSFGRSALTSCTAAPPAGIVICCDNIVEPKTMSGCDVLYLNISAKCGGIRLNMSNGCVMHHQTETIGAITASVGSITLIVNSVPLTCVLS